MKTRKNIIKLLISCYYDRMTIEAAAAFISRCYSVTVTPEELNAAKKALFDCGITW